jgi:hypothetical protein
VRRRCRHRQDRCKAFARDFTAAPKGVAKHTFSKSTPAGTQLVTSTVQHLMLQWPESPHPDSQREGLRRHARGRRPGVQGPAGSSTPSAEELPMAASNDPSRCQRQAIPAAGAVHPGSPPAERVRGSSPARTTGAARSSGQIWADHNLPLLVKTTTGPPPPDHRAAAPAQGTTTAVRGRRPGNHAPTSRPTTPPAISTFRRRHQRTGKDPCHLRQQGPPPPRQGPAAAAAMGARWGRGYRRRLGRPRCRLGATRGYQLAITDWHMYIFSLVSPPSTTSHVVFSLVLFSLPIKPWTKDIILILIFNAFYEKWFSHQNNSHFSK